MNSFSWVMREGGDNTRSILDYFSKTKPNPPQDGGIKWLSTYIPIRPVEMLNLKEGDIDIKLGYFIILQPKEKRPKLVPLIDEDLEMLSDMPRGLNDLEKFVIDFLKTANNKFNRSFNISYISWISRANFKSQVLDAPIIFKVKDTLSNHESFIFISNPSYPNFVIEAVNNAQQVHVRVTPSIQETILLPDIYDYYGSRSFAIYSARVPLSENRLKRRIQKEIIGKEVNKWLCDIFNCSKQPVLSDEEVKNNYLKPLSYLSNEIRFSDELREFAEVTISEIKSDKFHPYSTIQHGDFWCGNLLLQKKGFPLIKDKEFSFSVIDWGTANLKGYPFVDLIRYLLSTTKNKKKIIDYMNSYSWHCEIPIESCLKYVCTSIGWLGLHRNEFPVERYISSSEKLFRAANSLVYFK